jgi:hypothetical protein
MLTFKELIKEVKHFETFQKKSKEIKIKYLNICYDANLYLKYQGTQLKELMKEESAKLKVNQMKSGGGGKSNMQSNELLNEILRYKLDN